MRRFVFDRRGNVAIVLGIGIIPVVGFVGATLDYSRAADLRSFLQTKADAAALNAAVNGDEQNHATLLAGLEAEIASKYADVDGLAVGGEWITSANFRVDARATIDTAIIHILPGIDRGIEVAVRAVAQVSPEQTTYDPPEKVDLEPDAGDYNELFAYCYAYDSMGPPKTRRSQMTLIADNDGGDYNFEWPKCEEGEALSFRMRNVRHARAHPHVWNNPNQWPYRAEYDFYTDTALIGGVEQFSLRREITELPGAWEPYHDNPQTEDFEVLETVLCDSEEECVGESKGGIIPEGKGRIPQQANEPCSPGKFMYFGWEDRPPDQPGPNSGWTDPAWTDRSYDDIRIVMKCPETGTLGDRQVRLVE